MQADSIVTETPVAVGYETDFSGIADLLERHCPGIKDKMYDWKVRSGVYYAKTCRGLTLADKVDDEALKQWFRKRVGREGVAILRRLFIGRKNDIVCGEVTFGSETIYVFILNSENKATSQQKKKINAGDDYYRLVDIEPMRIPCRAYYHVTRTIAKKEWTTMMSYTPKGPQEVEDWYWKMLSTEQITKFE